MTRILLFLFAFLVAAPTTLNAYGNRLYYPYASPYHGYGYFYHPRADLEASRLRRNLRERHLHEDATRRRHEEEVGLLRQQVFANHQVGARQACYYRSTGGFELCADLFGDAEQKIAECELLVVQRNPSCNPPPVSDAR